MSLTETGRGFSTISRQNDESVRERCFWTCIAAPGPTGVTLPSASAAESISSFTDSGAMSSISFGHANARVEVAGCHTKTAAVACEADIASQNTVTTALAHEGRNKVL